MVLNLSLLPKNQKAVTFSDVYLIMVKKKNVVNIENYDKLILSWVG